MLRNCALCFISVAGVMMALCMSALRKKKKILAAFGYYLLVYYGVTCAPASRPDSVLLKPLR